MSVFPRLFSPRPNRWARRHTRRVEHRVLLDPKVELEVPMIRETWMANSTTYVDVTTLLRQIILIDVAKFVSPTFYFEAVIRAPATDNISYARLYNITDNVAVAGSEVSASELDWTRKRSGAISLSGSKQYKVQVRNTVAVSTHIISAARIIIVDETTTLTKTEHQIEVGNATFTTSATMIEIPWPSRYLFQSDRFDGTLAFYFEVTGYVSAKTGEFQLYNLTDGVEVSGSTVSTTSTSPVRLRSSAITLTSGKEYTVRYRNTVEGKTTYLAGAKIVIVQTRAEGITKMQVMKVVTGDEPQITSLTYVNSLQRVLLDLANFVGFSLTNCYEVVMRSGTAGVTVYSALRNLTDTLIVSNSEISTTLSTYARLRSGSLALLSTKEYVACGKTSDSAVKCYFKMARIIIDLAPPVAWKFTETLIISDRHVRTARCSRTLKQDLSVLRDIFTFIYTKAPIIRKFVETLIISVAFVRRHSGIRALRQDLSVLRDVFSFVYTPIVPPVYRFVQNLSVISVRVRRVHGIPRAFKEDLSVLRAVFVRKVGYSRKLPQVTVVRDMLKRFVGFRRRMVQDLSAIRDFSTRRIQYLRRLPQFTHIQAKFSSVLVPIIKVYRFVQSIVISALFRRRVSLVRRVRQDLSVFEAVFVRRAAYVRKQLEVVYVQVKAILKKIKKWLARLTKRIRLSIERPQHAEFKL